jgi:hypothetical protein
MAHDEENRYLQAARATLEQLDWCVAYLRRIHKPKLAAQLERNRKDIELRLRGPSPGKVGDA